jgi:C-terminal processing protease CtpA/Prc
MSRLGIKLSESNKQFVVSFVDPQGPAAKSNQIFKGDSIEKIDGIVVLGKSMEQVLAYCDSNVPKCE